VVSVEWFFEVPLLGLYVFFHSRVFVPGPDRSSLGTGREIIRSFLSYSDRQDNTLAMGRKGTAKPRGQIADLRTARTTNSGEKVGWKMVG
jgi:hypothetical protein